MPSLSPDFPQAELLIKVFSLAQYMFAARQIKRLAHEMRALIEVKIQRRMVRTIFEIIVGHLAATGPGRIGPARSPMNQIR